ncbi:hypothetical protein EYF80_029162 [Liparis tanakae]|uniref:Uncharacterized protein n=1 Tax=Liparis tanakae TaxID=230148 RepID=A0A4Z2H4K4_9TELE|nr:hypothetical protein EYF80_029162 [Liparis tanakae]
MWSRKPCTISSTCSSPTSAMLFCNHDGTTLMNRSRPWFSMKWRQVVGDSSVRFQSALNVNLSVASTTPCVAF